MIILGIETTCDETAAAVVRRTDDGRGRILSNIVLSQVSEHAEFGGVVPEIAARAHVEALDHIIAKAMAEAHVSFAALDGIAAAAGPGLIGGVIVGLTTAKAIALAHDKPLIAVNHLEAHALTARLTDATPFPIACFSPPAAIPRSSACAGSAIICGSAARSMTRSARPSTRRPSCSASAIPAARWSRRKRRAAIPSASRCRGR